MAPRPRQNSNKSRNRRRSSHKLKKQNSVKILSIESFRSNGGSTVRKQLSMDTETNVQMPNLQRLLSIPEVLLNATASVSGSGLACSSNHQKAHPTTSDPPPPSAKNSTPRSRIINMFAKTLYLETIY